jgi:hypothetical protein
MEMNQSEQTVRRFSVSDSGTKAYIYGETDGAI